MNLGARGIYAVLHARAREERELCSGYTRRNREKHKLADNQEIDRLVTL